MSQYSPRLKTGTPGTIQLIFLFFIAGLLLPSLISASEMKSGVDENGIIHVRVWALPQGPGTEPGKLAQWRVLKAFEKKHPKIKLHSATGLNLPGLGQAMDIGPLMAISGGLAPDVLYVNFRKSDSYISDEFLEPLDAYFEKMDPEELKFRIHPALWPVIKREGPINNKREVHIWALPDLPVVMMMAYRKDLFTKSGLDPNHPPDNWDELYQACIKLTSSKKGTFGIQLTTGSGTAWYFLNFLYSTGAKVVTLGKDGKWHANLATPEAAKALRFYKKLLAGKRPHESGRGFSTDNRKTTDDGLTGIKFQYLEGENIGAEVGSSGSQWGFAPGPKGPTGKRSAEINARMWGIFRGQKDQRVKDAAFKWLEFRGSKAARKILADTLIENNEVKSIHPAILKDLGEPYAKYRIFINKDIEKLYNDLSKEATPEPYGKNCDLIYDYMEKPIQKAIIWERQGKFEGMSEEEELKTLLGFLQEGQELIEIELIQNLPEDVKRFRSNVALAVCIFIFTAFIGLFLWVYRQFTPAHEIGRGWQFRKYWTAYLILLPAVGSIMLWNYLPLAWGSLMAFQDYKIAVPVVDWVGLENFQKVIFDPFFWYSLWLSLCYAALLVLFTWLPPVFLAIMLSEIPRGTVLYRVIFYLPAVISGLVIIFLWKTFFDPAPQGVFNQFLGIFGINQQYWFEDPHLAMLCIIIPLGWAHLGPGCLIYLAALKGIPDDMYEAADIDGATYWQKIRYIVFPKLKPILTIALIGQVIAGFAAEDNVLAMTGGGPNGATLVTGLLIFKKAFVYTKYGVATAMAWVTGLFLIMFTMYNLKILSRLEFKTTGDK